MENDENALVRRFFSASDKLFLDDGYVQLGSLELRDGARPQDRVLEQWGDRACELIDEIRYSTRVAFREEARDVVRRIADLAFNLEAIADRFRASLNTAHERYDMTLAEVHWHLQGANYNRDRADTFFRNAGETATTAHREPNRAVQQGMVAERWMDGVGAPQDYERAGHAFADFRAMAQVELDQSGRFPNDEMKRLWARDLELQSRDANTKLFDALEALHELWQAGYLAAFGDFYRVCEQVLEKTDGDGDDEPDAGDEDIEPDQAQSDEWNDAQSGAIPSKPTAEESSMQLQRALIRIATSAAATKRSIEGDRHPVIDDDSEALPPLGGYHIQITSMPRLP